jgi:hypothetical protein
LLTADGCADVITLVDDDCCPPPLCGNDLCCTFVAFFQLLPSGPLWDYWKAAAISYFQHNEDPAECPLITDPRCPSLILHAIYTVLKLRAMVHGPLWVAFRESNVYTAVTTLDAHLARLQWEDCYNQHCRSVLLGDITPLEIWTDCGPVFCPPSYPPELELAVKRGIAIALTRANMGVIKNLCGLNWIIAPLSAEIVPGPPILPTQCVDPPDPPGVPIYPDMDDPCTEVEEPPCTDNECDPTDPICNNASFIIQPTKNWLEGVGTGDVCDTRAKPPQVQAWWDWGCDKPAGLPEQVWPGILAAECIIRSMMPTSCVNNIKRAC